MEKWVNVMRLQDESLQSIRMKYSRIFDWVARFFPRFKSRLFVWFYDRSFDSAEYLKLFQIHLFLYYEKRQKFYRQSRF